MMVGPRNGGQVLARRQLLTDEERQALFGFPVDPDGLIRCFTLSRSDQQLVAERRHDTSRLGYAVQLALLRHPGTTLANLGQPVDPLVAWMAEQLDIPASAFARYAHRPQTVTDHARALATALGMRPATAVALRLTPRFWSVVFQGFLHLTPRQELQLTGSDSHCVLGAWLEW
jgi:TnpA family transposase